MSSADLAKNPLEEKTDDSNVEYQLQLLLQEAGLESVPIDPGSLEALKAFVASEDYSLNSINVSVTGGGGDNSTRQRGNNNNDNRPLPPMPEVEPHPEYNRFTSELTSPSCDSLCSAMEESSVAVAGSLAHIEGASPVENQILEALHRQTRLLLEMQRRVDDLTTTIEHLTSGGEITLKKRPGTTTTSSSFAPTITENPEVTTRPPVPVPPPRPPAPTLAQPRGAAPNVNNNIRNGGGVIHAIKNSRIFKIGLVFRALRRSYGVQELDGGLIFKILFMMAILTARMSSSSKRIGDPDWHTKFAVLALFVVGGFLAQTGYLKYFYIFFVKENFPGRIWNGEDVNAMIQNPGLGVPNINNNGPNQNNREAPALPRGNFPPNHPQHGQDANNNNGGGWRNTFLGGLIPQAQQGGVAGALQDVALFFGSFLMSIFPMWHPEGPPQPRQPPPQPRQPPPPPPAGGVAAGPGAVRPPRDPVQAVDDSDEED